MNKVTLSEVKTYLGIDGEDYNKILSVFLASSEHICEKVLRRPVTEGTPEIVKTAQLFVKPQLIRQTVRTLNPTMP
jgi:hypothetical protein